METFLIDIVKYSLPSLFSIILVYIFFRFAALKQTQIEERELKLKAYQAVIPLKLAAYERITLYIERIRPDKLLSRHDPNYKTIKTYQDELLEDINSEFEHNVVQQIYISDEAWRLVLQSKNQMLELINESAKELSIKASGLSLFEKIFTKVQSNEDLLYGKTLNQLRQDIVDLFST